MTALGPTLSGGKRELWLARVPWLLLVDLHQDGCRRSTSASCPNKAKPGKKEKWLRIPGSHARAGSPAFWPLNAYVYRRMGSIGFWEKWASMLKSFSWLANKYPLEYQPSLQTFLNRKISKSPAVVEGKRKKHTTPGSFASYSGDMRSR